MRKIRDVALEIPWRTSGVVYFVEGARHEGLVVRVLAVDLLIWLVCSVGLAALCPTAQSFVDVSLDRPDPEYYFRFLLFPPCETRVEHISDSYVKGGWSH